MAGLTFTTDYEYDLAGNLTAIVYPQTTPGDPARRRVDYIRDNLGRIDSIVSSITTIGLPQTVASAIGYLPFGPFDTLTYGNGLVLTRDYDLAYRLEAQTITGVDSLDWVLDKAGNVDDLNRDGNLLQDFSYDVIHRLDDESGDYGERDYVYDENANRESVTYDGPTTETLTYDPGTNRIATRDGVALAYDPAGNMTFDGLDRAFAYNITRRLQSVTQAGQLRASYTYDALGRRIVKTLPDLSQVLYHYDLGGQLLAEHHLAGSKVTEYVYFGGVPAAQFEQGALVDTDGDGIDDAADNCIDDQNVTQCDTNADGWGNHCDADLDNSGLVNFVDLQILKDRMFAQGEDDADLNCDLIINFTDLQIMKESMFGPPGPSGLNGELGQGAVVYLHPDRLGTPRAGSDGDGTVTWRWDSDAFGVGAPEFDVDGDDTPTTVNLRFPGQYYDAESGLHYNFHRYYDPLLGRYITSDAIGLAGGRNTYGYAMANPMVFADPNGQAAVAVGVGVGVIVVGGACVAAGNCGEIVEALGDALEDLARARDHVNRGIASYVLRRASIVAAAMAPDLSSSDAPVPAVPPSEQPVAPDSSTTQLWDDTSGGGGGGSYFECVDGCDAAKAVAVQACNDLYNGVTSNNNALGDCIMAALATWRSCLDNCRQSCF